MNRSEKWAYVVGALLAAALLTLAAVRQYRIAVEDEARRQAKAAAENAARCGSLSPEQKARAQSVEVERRRLERAIREAEAESERARTDWSPPAPPQVP